jgi:hypothetical protein
MIVIDFGVVNEIRPIPTLPAMGERLDTMDFSYLISPRCAGQFSGTQRADSFVAASLTGLRGRESGGVGAFFDGEGGVSSLALLVF